MHGVAAVAVVGTGPGSAAAAAARYCWPKRMRAYETG